MDGTGKLFTNFVDALPSDIEARILSYPADRIQSHTQLLQLLEFSLPSTDPFVLVAESFSAPLAIEWASRSKFNLRGLILCAGFAASPIPGWKSHLCLLLSRVCFLIPPPEVVIRTFLVGTDAPSSLVAAVKGAIASVSPRVLAHRLRLTLTCDARPALQQVQVPILFIQPTQDRLVSSSCLKAMLEVRPEALVELVACPHLLLQSRARESAEIVANYARKFSPT
jgi:pimeloyl-ACP methyl ester carboxylesterase